MTAPLYGPEDWTEFTLGDLLSFSNGINADKSAYGTGVPFANVMEVIRNESLSASGIPGRISLPKSVLSRYEVKRGDILFNRTSETPEELGLTSVYLDDVPIVFGGFVFRGRPLRSEMDVQFSKYAFRGAQVRQQITMRSQGEIRANIGQRDLNSVCVSLPAPPEQKAIAEALDDVSRFIDRLDRLIEKKQAIRSGLMHALLTAAVRLPGFDQPWKSRKLEKLLAPRTERNVSGEAMEVLSCTKHLGFVRSLDYFKSQVFSRDLSGYRVIRRGDIGYPANHVEEGSIGVQEDLEVGLVSPIYVVMRPLPGVNSYFLQRQLKLESYRQEFARATNSSVNRRGSLRWPQFSQIEVVVPEEHEQNAIAKVIRGAEAEVRCVQLRRIKAVALKQGMMQELLSGRTRLPVEEPVV